MALVDRMTLTACFGWAKSKSVAKMLIEGVNKDSMKPMKVASAVTAHRVVWDHVRQLALGFGVLVAVVSILPAQALTTWDDSITTSPFLKQELATGARLERPMLSHYAQDNNGPLTAYVNQLAKRLTPYSPVFYPYKVVILNETRSAVAYASPGGIIYLSHGLIATMENESQLAGVLSHMMMHVAKRHVYWQYQTRMSYWRDAEDNANNPEFDRPTVKSPIGEEATWLDAMMYQALPFDYETDADVAAAQTMVKAGFNPKGYIDWLKKMTALEQTGVFVQYSDLHPNSSARIETLLEAQQRQGWDIPGLVVDSQRFHDAIR